MARKHRLVGDALRDHRLAEPLWRDQDDVAGRLEEVAADGGLDEVAVDLLGPLPVEVGHSPGRQRACEPKDLGEVPLDWTLPLDDLDCAVPPCSLAYPVIALNADGSLAVASAVQFADVEDSGLWFG